MNKNLYFYWLRLYNFLQFLRMEGYIEQITYDEMSDNLMNIKGAVMDEDEKEEK